jgi:magnesium transporter
VRWLLTNLVTALVPATIVFFFDATIAQKAVLAALMPIVAGVGGNAGTQTLAVTVRALATNQLTESNSLRTIRRELLVALLNGATVAAVIGIVVGTIFWNADLGFVIGSAMLANIMIAGFAGVAVPLTLERFNADPAEASSIFVTMTTDSMGFLVFLGLAAASGLVS